MAVTYTYNTTLSNVRNIYRATSAGTVFSANLVGGAFDYFTDTAVVNDAIYFSWGTNTLSDLTLNVGTAMVGTGITLAWEYYRGGVGWTAIHNLKDDTVGFTVIGANRVRFPHQWEHNNVSINGSSNLWVRCRISALTTITEGGANTSDTVQTADGSVHIIGGTEIAPGNFKSLVTYMNANYPYVTCTYSNPGTFDFKQISIKCDSYLRSNNELILIGNNNVNGGCINALDYFLSGELVGTKAKNGSTFMVYGTINTSVLTFSAASTSHCKVYGATFNSPYGNPFGYIQTYNTSDVQYCNFQSSILLADCNFTNCRFYTNFIIANAPYNFTGNSVVFSSPNMMYCYTTGFTLKDFDFKYYTASNSYLCYGYQASGKYNQVWELINPGTKLNALADTGITTKPITYGASYVNLTSCKFYDVSAGTYTTYTTEANNDTAGDVPLTGDVGDYYMFGAPNSGGTTTTSSLSFELPDQANDYEYVWERYNSTTWMAIDTSWLIDSTANLTKSGTVFMWDSSTLSTLDGVSACWIRARIVTKGTASPVATRIRKHNLSCASRWTINEKYTLDLQVVDDNGANISGATVVMKDSTGTQIFSTTTDANGVITQQLFFSKKWWFDPVNANTYPYASEIIYGNMTMTISKTGYETYESKGIPSSDKLTLVIKLKPIVQLRATDDGVAYATNPELGSDSMVVLL